ncbi:unnamed protein product [Fusarium graminearum]|uniref:Chromosome 1, complete genome n=1 Tax=Gibberella zeae (strain ATCC MYA-4620 / CBS 123657 / FGSC 9075 / NRRL 31084 / PH-1) TaxID=229533 RepID=A0A098D129_GIBZE|nr:unnamed protein product [Fusarium graminearum]CZS75883.1 unnamed protein product [Fusarium graminearum]
MKREGLKWKTEMGDEKQAHGKLAHMGGEDGGRHNRQTPNVDLASRGVTETFHFVTKVD